MGTHLAGMGKAGSAGYEGDTVKPCYPASCLLAIILVFYGELA